MSKERIEYLTNKMYYGYLDGDETKEYIEYINELLKENQQLKDNWKELKKWLEERKFVYNITGEDLDEDTSITEVLDKMYELDKVKE